jgi:hypothetical protein
MCSEYFTVSNVEEALNILAERGPSSRIIAGATEKSCVKYEYGDKNETGKFFHYQISPFRPFLKIFIKWQIAALCLLSEDRIH